MVCLKRWREGGRETHELLHTGLFLPDKTACHTHPCILGALLLLPDPEGVYKSGKARDKVLSAVIAAAVLSLLLTRLLQSTGQPASQPGRVV